MKKEQKMKWCLIPMGKIGLMWKLISVCYNICYINLNKGKEKKKNLWEVVRRCFFSLKLSFVTISFVFVWHHRDDVVSKREVQEDFHSWVARPDSGKRMVLSSGRFNCFPDSDINLLHCLGKACTLFKLKLSPLRRGQGRHKWSVRPLSDHSLYFCFYVDSAPALHLTY